MAMSKSKQVDRISALSNVLLSFILSSLPMKDVVTTSLLSRRWKYLWTKVSVLNFSCSNPHVSQQPSFSSFVYKALLLNTASVTQRFCLDHLSGVEDFHINSWVWSVMQRKVSEISLSCSRSNEKRLAKALFSSEFLGALKLNGKFILPSIVPSKQHLPHLELLHLTNVAFEHDDQTLLSLLSICPRLKDLLLNDIFRLNEIYIRSSSVRKLEIISTADTKKNLVLETPKLEYMILTEKNLCYDIEVVGSLAGLVEVTFDIVCPSKGHRCGIFDLLQRIPGLKTLKIAQSNINRLLECYGAQLPVFRNLAHLELANSTGPLVLQLLEHSINLASLTLHKLDCIDDSWGPVDYWLSLPEHTPSCLSRTLKMVEINDFCGYGSHLKLAKYILTYAEVLKVMRIYTANEDRECEMEALMELFRVDRASRHCGFSIWVP